MHNKYIFDRIRTSLRNSGFADKYDIELVCSTACPCLMNLKVETIILDYKIEKIKEIIDLTIRHIGGNYGREKFMFCTGKGTEGYTSVSFRFKVGND